VVDKIASGEIAAFVLPDGEVRFPRWQFGRDGDVRLETPAIVAAAKAAKLGALDLNLLMTKPGGAGKGRTLASLLGGRKPSDADALAAIASAIASDWRGDVNRRRRARAR
jgi:hypothetical protein